MTARIIDGNALSARVRGEIAERAAALTALGVQPCLAVMLVGADPASAVYVRNKVAGCEKAGIRSLRFDYPETATQAEVMAKLAELNADPAVHGILVQLPLPKHLDETAVLEAIDLKKDVDGFHAENVGRLSQCREAFIPCTPHGVMKMLESSGTPVQGAEAVVIGRSNIVGKPMATLLTNAGATVTVCHSRTKDLAFHTRRADILVAAIGKPRFVTGDMIKPGATVIDVGINRLQDGPDAGKLCGDVDFESAREVAGAITPVPGGVGPMTITMLLENTVISAERAASDRKLAAGK
ncbi:bifunctional methylenetetrahydrofolate dehydrogenase/methenyltetrahydrofolate cyclohydrolase FolD [Thauera aminoaromatica]|jgi:methylenetetrahydrofolate dehydrogenase (NADP+)/methenyltetrahydrofolate cyclohydrolase|uniref:Bifunctional protein FolD n=2 Tax=Thauera aminoaromatica TaxID=164330 RepID=N6Z2Q5_THASP|nr:bifunctional methylenetetrahydrofolate dehydrogenase/methenyltetrahydrofolate cyclohydrolase FolD [Thauera aminoaromatica]ACR01785.1 Methenyltetrahydrofolate cyclohydrolase [Thauera aminoaromatica]ENO88877.1 bifunctional 5,10-methylene-tetrahydrofolate dehydrogenase/ 5,10-methylene-tetrahydrofolate cyclohydrolase [Thauera aminoaromatica S2]